MKKIDRIIEKCKEFKLYNNRFLVYTPKIRTYKGKDIVLDDEKNKGKDPIKDEMEVKEVDKEFKYEYQVATIVATPDDETDFKVGDEILIEIKYLKEFDFYKPVNIIQKFNINVKKEK